VLREPLKQRLENYEAVGGAELNFRGALGMGHHTQYVAFAITDAGDICDGAVRICRGVFTSIESCVTENNLIVAFERVES